MSTNKKLQSALELLSTYGFMLSIVAIILILVFFIANPIPSVVPNQCNAYGISCQHIVYASNSVSNTANIILYLNNSESSPENINSANIIINGKAFQGPCLNHTQKGTFLEPGKGGTCTITLTPSTSIGTRITGQFNVAAQICNSAVSSFSESTCNYLPITYTGTFVLVSRTYSTTLLNLAFQAGTQITEGQSDTLTASTSVIGDKISVYECSGSGCTLPQTPLVSGTTTATYNVGSFAPGIYEIDACDTTQNICSGTSTLTVLVQCYALTLSGSGTQAASPTSSGGCPANEYTSGTSVSITATASSGYAFTSWSGSGTGSYTGTANPATITMNSAITETANYAALVSCQETFITYASDSSMTFSATISYTMYGGGGGGGSGGGSYEYGSPGQEATGSFSVNSGDSLTIYVGGGGGGTNNCGGGGGGGSGWFGGGGGGSGASSSGGGGGGSSAIILNGILVQYAAGGAGGLCLSGSSAGGGSNTGGAAGIGGTAGNSGGTQAGGDGGGGTKWPPGYGGSGGSGGSGSGSGCSPNAGTCGGGGGGGFGGGGGASEGSGGSTGANGGSSNYGTGGIGGSTGVGGNAYSGGYGGSIILSWSEPSSCSTI